MRKLLFVAGMSVLAVAVSVPLFPAMAKQRTVIEQLPPDLVDRNYVDKVEVIVADTAAKKMAELESKANDKRTEAGLSPFVDGEVSLPRDQYATVPFAAMMPRVMRDVTRKWGLTAERGGKPVDLRVMVEGIRTANAGMALLLGSSDELSGEVVVFDSSTGQRVGNFYVQVVNSHGGLSGLAMRGAGIREKLVEEFALESSRILTGSTKKDWKKRVKAIERAEKESQAAKASRSGVDGQK